MQDGIKSYQGFESSPLPPIILIVGQEIPYHVTCNIKSLPWWWGDDVYDAAKYLWNDFWSIALPKSLAVVIFRLFGLN